MERRGVWRDGGRGGVGPLSVAFVADPHADSLAASFQLGWLRAAVTDFLKAQPWTTAFRVLKVLRKEKKDI